LAIVKLKKIIEKYNPNLNYNIASLPQFIDSPSKTNYGDIINFVVSQKFKISRRMLEVFKILTEKDTAEYIISNKKSPARLDLIQNHLNEPASGIFTRQILLSQNWYQYDFQEINQIFKEMIEDITHKGKSPYPSNNYCI